MLAEGHIVNDKNLLGQIVVVKERSEILAVQRDADVDRNVRSADGSPINDVHVETKDYVDVDAMPMTSETKVGAKSYI